MLLLQSNRGRKRKGARIKAQMENRKRAIQRKLEEKNKPPKKWVPPNLRIEKSNIGVTSRRYNEDLLLDLPPDDVYHCEGFKQIAYSLAEAIKFHQETHHPTMYNEPNAVVDAFVELNLRTKKKTKFLSAFTGMLMMPHEFDFKQSRRLVVICKKPEDQEKALNLGASIVGSNDVIKQLKSKNLTSIDFDHILCHSDMLIELAEVRGILKEHFPNKLKGNYGTDIEALMKKFTNSIEYKCVRDDFEPDFGTISVPFGRLNCKEEHLLENLVAVLQKIEGHQPKDAPGEFITRVLIKSKPSSEEFRIRHWDLLENYEDPYAVESENDSNEEMNELRQ
ncbi:39S ribosomal protein L1-like protein [Leptotrombidium deliense]|uniref:39S ribosomal protein L1-like protein n=1 Tax=Leptotrombidium deliense TaxID=299467 RepID=A0A443SKS3_9ACAR|nr:39S ribosomal protein L1-like protein [Leptotrombidium deliense]